VKWVYYALLNAEDLGINSKNVDEMLKSSNPEIKRVLGLDSVMMGLFLPEDNLHAPNESFNLDVMKKGIETSKRILSAIAAK